MDYRLEQLRFELREDPSSRVFFKLGEHLRREGELEEAIEVLGTGLEQHPRYVAAWVSLGRALLDAGSTRRAADALGRALALDPENAVASRLAGEAAIANGEWVEAVKGLKRARALSAPDEALDERIAFVEEHLAEIGQLAARPSPAPVPAGDRESAPPAGRSLDVVFAEAEAEASPPAGADDVFVVDVALDAPSQPAPTVEDNGRSTVAVPMADMPIPRSVEEVAADVPVEAEGAPEVEPVFEIDADAVIATEASYDFSGGTEDAFDVRAEGDFAQPPEQEPVFAVDTEPETTVDFGIDGPAESDVESSTMPVSVAEIETGDASEPDFHGLPEVEDEAETGVEPESADLPEIAGDFDLEDEDEVDDGVRAEELPLPTMTLARLALDQADLELAEKTLRGVLERNPNHTEAAELLAGLTASAGDAASPGSPVPLETGDSRARALRRWLEAVRLASERLKT